MTSVDEPAHKTDDLWIEDEPDTGPSRAAETEILPTMNPGLMAGFGTAGLPAAPPVVAYDAVRDDDPDADPRAGWEPDAEPLHEEEPPTGPRPGATAWMSGATLVSRPPSRISHMRRTRSTR